MFTQSVEASLHPPKILSWSPRNPCPVPLMHISQIGSRTFYTNGERARTKAQEMVVFDTTWGHGKTQMRVSQLHMWPCHFASSDPVLTLPGYNHRCPGSTESWRRGEPSKNLCECSHSHSHHLVQHFPGGNIVSVYVKKNVDGIVVVALNSTWDIVQYFFNTFSVLPGGPRCLGLRAGLLFILRNVLGRQEGINVETQKHQQYSVH